MPQQSKEAQIRQAFSTLNDVPIDFYGKLEDQFGNPVAAAQVTGNIQYDNGISNGVKRVQTVSDASGFFELHGGKGASLSVIPKKEGYALASDNAGFKYSHFYPETRHIPDPSHPVALIMRKLQGAERLIHYQGKIAVPLNGSAIQLDLQTGTIVNTEGDLIIRVESSPVPNPMDKYGWKATVQVVNGGVITSSIEFEKMFAAPESGYEPEFVVSYATGSHPWANGFTGAFYLKSRSGRNYGKFGFIVNTDIVKDGKVYVIVSSYVNPAGSRNLEIDPALVTEVKP